MEDLCIEQPNEYAREDDRKNDRRKHAEADRDGIDKIRRSTHNNEHRVPETASTRQSLDYPCERSHRYLALTQSNLPYLVPAVRA